MPFPTAEAGGAARKPRQARLDAPGTLHHVILRGIERGRIVADAADRVAFLARLGDVATATWATVYAWALLPSHAHLLLRSGAQGLSRGMRRILTGYAQTHNRRRGRIAAVRSRLALHLVTQLGFSLAESARQLGVSTSGIAKAIARAERG